MHTPIYDPVPQSGYTPTYAPQTRLGNIASHLQGEFSYKPSQVPMEQEPDSFSPSLANATNDYFIPIVEDGERPTKDIRIEGLRAYVTADMRESSRQESDRIFGQTRTYASDHTTNMYVGRALAAACDTADNPSLFFRNPGAQALGFKAPNEATDFTQLYASIGSQFAEMERAKMQELITHEQSVIAERSKDPKALTNALLNALTRSSITPDERILLDAAGITPESIRKANGALNLFQQQYEEATLKTEKGQTKWKVEEGETKPFDDNLLRGKELPAFEYGFGGETLNEFNADFLADYFGEDAVARGIFLEFIAMAGERARSQEEGHEIAAAIDRFYSRGLERLGKGLAEAFWTTGSGDSLVDDRRNAMRHDIKAAYEEGYNRRNKELGFSLARIPVSAADAAASTVGFLGTTMLTAEALTMSQENIDEAASNIYRTDAANMNADFMERKGTPLAKTATFGTAIALTGGMAKGAAVLGSRLAPKLAARIAGSKAATYGVRVLEGVTTEAIEEVVNAVGQEGMEAVGLVEDRQKKDHYKELADTLASPDFWSANAGMNLIFGLTGYRGSRSKEPYQLAERLVSRYGFGKKEAETFVGEVQDAIGEGKSKEEVRQMLASKISAKLSENPSKVRKGMVQDFLDLRREQDMADAAADGVRDALLKEANISNMVKDADGKYACTIVKHGKDGKFESIEQKMTEDQLNEWLTTEAANRIATLILDTQAQVRGEQTSRAAEKLIGEGKSPFQRIAYLQDAPAEVLAKLKGKAAFDLDTFKLFAKYAVDEINRRMAKGETRAQAEAAEFGTTGASLASVRNIASEFSNRITIEQKRGNLTAGANAESAAFILPGKTVGDNILMLARGEATVKDVAHDWLEGFARSRYYSDPEAWATRLDALDRELQMRGLIRESMFDSQEGERNDLEYIEALSHLAEQRWLIDHEQYRMTDAAHALLADMLEEVGAVQNGLAVAHELKNFMESEDGKAILNDQGALSKLMAESNAALSDLLAEADQQSPQSAADFILQHRERMRRELEELATQTETPPPPNPSLTADPNEQIDITTDESVSAAEVAAVNGINPETGTLKTPPPTAYRTVTAPKGAGLGLNGGIAHRMHDGSIEGSAPLASLTLHPSLAGVDLTRAQGDTSAPVVVYRKKDGTMQIIGGFARYQHDTNYGLTNTHVKVFGASKKRPHNWAADYARANSIRSGLASVADTLRHMAAHGYSRLQAYKANLVPKGADGKELPTSRAAWLLHKHATKKTISELTAGHITTREALATIADKVDTLDLEEQGRATASFSVRAKEKLTFTSDNSLSGANVDERLKRLSGKKLYCRNSEIVAYVNSRQRGKIVSPKARDKSAENGFTHQQHLTLADKIDELYEYAIPLGEYMDKNGRKNVKAIFRFATPVQIDGIQAIALLTLKRVDKDNLYSLELEEIKQLGGTLDRLKNLRKENPSAIPLRADEEILNAFSEKVKEYFGETSSFSIREKRRRQYTGVPQLYQNELFAALYDEAVRMERETINFTDRNARIDDILRNSARVRGLMSAMFKILPRDAQPWKTMLDLPERVNTLSRAALNPHEQLSMQDSPGLDAREIERYNDLTPEQRRAAIAQKLSSAYTALLKAAARSIEAHLCRNLMAQADAAMNALLPKQQKSGKERRGVTSSTVYARAKQLHDMMDWTSAQQAEEEQRLMGILNDKTASQQEIDNAETELRLVHLFAGLRWAPLAQTREGVEQFLKFIETGRAQWEHKLHLEREHIDKIRAAIANLQPEVRTTKVKNKEKPGIVGNVVQFVEAMQNIVQTLDTLSTLPGKSGEYFAQMSRKISVALDSFNYASQQSVRDIESALDSIIGAKGCGLARWFARAKKIVEWNKLQDSGIKRAGTIRITRFELTKEDVERIAKIKEEQGKDAFERAMHEKFKRANVNQDYRLGSLPYEEAFADALSQTQDPNYRGGRIYVEHFGARDTDHTESLTLTPMQAANLVMMADQPSYSNHYDEQGNLIKRGTMDINGYTPEVLAQLRAYAGPELMAWCNAMRESFNHTGLFEAYAEYMGLPFPKEENYWPGMFDTPQVGALDDALDSAQQGNGLHQMLIKRRDHMTEPNIGFNAYDVWERAIQQHHAYVNLSPITREIRRLLRDTDTQTRLKDLASVATVSNLNTLLDVVDGAPALSLRSAKAANDTFALVFAKRAYSLLSGALASAVKQVTGVLNAIRADGINLVNLPFYIIKSLTGAGHITPRGIMQLKTFKNRVGRENLSRLATKLDPGQTISPLSIVKIWGMRWMETPDAWSNAFGMAAVYNQEYDSLSRAILATPGHPKTLSEQEIRDIEAACEQKVSHTMHAAAQPMERTDKAAFLQQRNAWMSATMYMQGEAIVKAGLVASAIRKEINKAAGKSRAERNTAKLKALAKGYGYLSTFSMANQLVIMALAVANGSAPDDDDAFMEWVMVNILVGASGFGIIQLFPFVGESVAALGQLYTGDPYGPFATYADTGLGLSARDIKELVNAFDEDKSAGERFYSTANVLRIVGTFTNVLAGKSVKMTYAGEVFDAINTGLNIFRPLIQRWKNEGRKERLEAKRKKKSYTYTYPE